MHIQFLFVNYNSLLFFTFLGIGICSEFHVLLPTAFPKTYAFSDHGFHIETFLGLVGAEVHNQRGIEAVPLQIVFHLGYRNHCKRLFTIQIRMLWLYIARILVIYVYRSNIVHIQRSWSYIKCETKFCVQTKLFSLRTLLGGPHPPQVGRQFEVVSDSGPAQVKYIVCDA